jgi:hypothetical protein
MSKARSEDPRRLLGFLMLFGGCAFVLLILWFISPHQPEEKVRTDRQVCASNLRMLGLCTYVYADERGTPLAGDRWCDELLAAENDLIPKYFRCPSSEATEGQCSYALNAAAAGKDLSSLPPDMVVFFDSAPGWNQVGGPELLTMDNHGGEGCCVYFVDRHTEWVSAEHVGWLRWTAEEPNRPDAD